MIMMGMGNYTNVDLINPELLHVVVELRRSLHGPRIDEHGFAIWTPDQNGVAGSIVSFQVKKADRQQTGIFVETEDLGGTARFGPVCFLSQSRTWECMGT
jgi:hypothetical protein